MPVFIVDAGSAAVDFEASDLAEAIQRTLTDVGSLFRTEKGVLHYDLAPETSAKILSVTADNPITICISCNELILGSFDVYTLKEIKDAR